MKKTFELDYPGYRNITAHEIQMALCASWGERMHMREVLAEPDETTETIGVLETHVLGHLLDGGSLYCNDHTGTCYVEREDVASVPKTSIARLVGHGLIELVATSADKPPSIRYYAITDKGRAVLAESDPHDPLG